MVQASALPQEKWFCLFFPVLSALFSALLSALFFSDAATASVRALRFEQIGVEQGLPQESVTSVLQDSQGYMWFGTQAGLARYDAYRMTVYKSNPRDPTSLIDNYVLSSFEDAQGGLWFGTKGGLNHYDRLSQKFTRYVPDQATPDTSSNRTVAVIVKDGVRGLWLGTEDGLKRFDFSTRQFTALRHDPDDPASIRDNRINALVHDRHGNLWIGTASGLDCLKPGLSSFDHINIDIAGRSKEKQNSVRTLAIGADEQLWLGSDNGLTRLALKETGASAKAVADEQGLAALAIQSLFHDKQNKLWIGTITDGLKRLDPASGTLLSYRHHALDRNSLANNEVRALYQDRSGTLWIGTWFGGLSRLDLSSGGFERFVQNQGNPANLSENKIRSILDDGAGGYWLGTLGGGLNHLDPLTGTAKTWRRQAADDNSLADDRVAALAHGEAGRLWIGTRGGLSWFDPKSERFTRVRLGSGLKENYIQKILPDRSGQIWILTQGGVHRRDSLTGAIKTFRHDARDPHSLGEDSSLAALEDSHGTLWIGTENGLDRLDRKTGRFSHFRHDASNPDSLIHNRIHDLFEDSKGALWIGTAGGVNRLISEKNGALKFQFYPTKGDGSADPIGGILEDDLGGIWVSSTSGLARLNRDSGHFKHYTAKDGLLEGSYFVGAAFKAPDGTLNFGGLNGLTSFKPADIRDNPYPPAVVITDFLIFNQSVYARTDARSNAAKSEQSLSLKENKAITLSYRDSVFSLEFAALHFADPLRNQYAYQLQGFDRAWVSTDAGKRYATYTNLDPGNYVFRVKASNKDGVWNESGTSLSITITPPYWKTWWFRGLLASILVAGAYVALRVRVRSLIQQKLILTQQVSSATSALLEEKNLVEQQKESLELAHRNISLLSEIGREITAKLDSEEIIMMLYRSVNELMVANVFGIGIYRPELEIIEYPFAVEDGKRYSPYVRDMREPNQLAVWCISHQKDVFINDLEQEYQQYISSLELTSGPEHLGTLADGSLPKSPCSLLYVPISVNGKMRGVISVHSFEKNAYQRIHLDMLRTLAAYVGVALDNADAYLKLKDTQQQLVEQGKLAGLGSLVAGVAHELNTPIGNSLMIASTMHDKTEEMALKLEQASMRKSDLTLFIASAREASVLIVRSLKNAANLINSFKQVAVDQTSAKRRRFNLLQVTQEIVATMINQVRKSGHTLELDIGADIEMDSYPGPYGQVIINFISNVLLHAFDGQSGGKIELSAGMLGTDKVQIRFQDSGMGIGPQDLARIFEPFFTTKLGQGGSGLGLHISYNIVTSLLEGQIRVESTQGRGTTFILDLPLSVSSAGE